VRDRGDSDVVLGSDQDKAVSSAEDDETRAGTGTGIGAEDGASDQADKVHERDGDLTMDVFMDIDMGGGTLRDILQGIKGMADAVDGIDDEAEDDEVGGQGEREGSVERQQKQDALDLETLASVDDGTA
jgi:hypothetical protein